MMHSRFLTLFFLLLTFSLSATKYSGQANQDEFVHKHFFRHQKTGFFCDIGAHDGKTFSNTYFFEKYLGWKGICFEPLPHLFDKLIECRDCICKNVCVSAKEGLVHFIHVDSCDEMLSGIAATFDRAYLDIVVRDTREFGGACNIIQLPSVRLMRILAEHQITEIDFLSLDTEGSELEILKTIDFDVIKIKVITVENNHGENALRDFLISKGYTFLTRLHVDDVFYRKDLITYTE